MQRNKKTKLSTSYLKYKAFSIVIFISTPLIILVQEQQDLNTFSISIILLLWAISLTIWLFAKTRNNIYYNNETFFIYDWKNNEIDKVSNSQITSVRLIGLNYSYLHSSPSYKIFYSKEMSKESFFYLIPNVKTESHKIIQRLKEINPSLVIDNFSRTY